MPKAIFHKYRDNAVMRINIHRLLYLLVFYLDKVENMVFMGFI